MSASLVRASVPWCCGRTGAAAVGNSLCSSWACYGQRVALWCSSTPPPGFSMGPSPADIPELPSIDTPLDFEAPPGVDVPMPGMPVPGTPPSSEQPGPSIPSPQTPDIPAVPTLEVRGLPSSTNPVRGEASPHHS